MQSSTDQLVPRFEQFLQQLQSVMSSDQELGRFMGFVTQCESVIAEALADPLAHAKSVVQPIMPLIDSTDVDLLQIAGIQGDENRYTNLIAWMLSPQTNRTLAKAIQHHWLRQVGLSRNSFDEPARVITQVVTDDGIPDLILIFPDSVIIVEAKTETAEHPTPGGQMQTFAYPPAVRRFFRLPDEFPIHIFFLTMDGTLPANPEAHSTTYLDVCFAVGAALQETQVSASLRSGCESVLRHFLLHATPSGLDVPALLNLLQACHWKITKDAIPEVDKLTSLLALMGERL